MYFEPATNQLYFLGDQFVVNSDDGWELGIDPALVHPTVSVSTAGDGDFLIAWNANTFAQDPDSFALGQNAFQWGVRGQFFDSSFRSVGPNFDVSPNPTPGVFATFDVLDRTLAESAQHTIDYGLKGAKVATWTATTQEEPIVVDVWVTEFNIQFAPTTIEDYFNSQPGSCEKGDTDFDGSVTLADLPSFVALLLSSEPSFLSYAELCPADTNSDGLADGRDIQCFVNLLLGFPLSSCEVIGNPCDNGFEPPEQLMGGEGEMFASSSPSEASSESGAGPASETAPQVSLDCNSNGVADATEIASGAATDCNGNGRPDSCDMSVGFIVSYDCNDNGVPDECDVVSGFSADANLNGFPDECDASEGIEIVARPWPADEASFIALIDFGEPAACSAFYEWSETQPWGPGATIDGEAFSGGAQFHRMIEKRRALGLPLSDPFALFHRYAGAP